MDFSDFVGLPWSDRGRTPDGYDCYGLVREVFQAGTGVALPSHADDYSTAADRAETSAIIAGAIDDWIEIERGSEMAFDVALMRVSGRLHIGIIVRRGLVLHLPHKKTSVIEPLSRFSPETRLYRHAGAQL